MSSWNSAGGEPASRPTDRQVAVLLGVVVMFAAILATAAYPVGVFVDDGYYLILGKAMATGHGLRYLQLPGEPYGTRFPPGYPLLLAALWKIAPQFPQNVALFKSANAVLLGFAASLGYLLGVRTLGLRPRTAAAAVLFGAASIPALVLAGMVLSETMFLVVLIAALLADEAAIQRPGIRSALVAGLVSGALPLVRTVGALVLPVVALVLWRRRGWRLAAVTLAAGALVALPWQLWVAAHPFDQAVELTGSFGSYGGWIAQGFRDLGWSAAYTVPAHTAGLLADNLRVLVAPLIPLVLKDVVLAVALAVSILGAWATARRSPAFVWSLAAYLLVVVSWPFAPLRFVWGIWVLLTLLFAAGAVAIAAWRPAGRLGVAGRWAALGACGLVVAGNLLYNVRGYYYRWWESIPRQVTERAMPLLDWASRHTAPEDVLVIDYDAMQYLYVGRLAVPAFAFTAAEYLHPRPVQAEAQELGHIVQYYHARYVITSAGSVVRAADELNRHGGVRLVRVDSTPPQSFMFRVEPSPARSAARR